MTGEAINDFIVYEVELEINDSTTSHNNNHAIHLRSKTENVEKLLVMAEEFLNRHKCASEDKKHL
jgi:hypothetical protein